MITASEQTSGIGSNGRVWLSPPGNVYATFVFPWPKDEVPLSLYVPQVTNLSVCQTAEAYGFSPQLKWINDMLLDGKKSAGLLCKGFIGAESASSIVVGIGLNVNMDDDVVRSRFDSLDDPMKVPFTSLKLSSGRTFDVEDVLSKLTENLFRNYKTLLSTKDFAGSFLSDINSRLAYRGERVVYQDDPSGGVPAPSVTGVFDGIDESGFALLSLDDGSKKTAMTGRIRPESYVGK